MAKMLIVDDDAILARLYKNTMENEGFEVICAVNGEDALEKIKTFVPDIIISDFMMPRMDGLQFLKELKENKEVKSVPVVMMTNLRDEENEKQALAAGATKYVLKKDAGPKAMVELVKELLP